MGKKRKEKNPSGQGGVSERKDGRFDAYLTIYTLDGPKVARTTKRNKQEAYRWLNKMRHDRDEGQIPNFAANRVTVGEYLDGWLEAIQGTVSRHTWHDYEGKVRLHLKPALGKLKLKDLTAAHLQTLYARLSVKLSPGAWATSTLLSRRP